MFKRNKLSEAAARIISPTLMHNAREGVEKLPQRSPDFTLTTTKVSRDENVAAELLNEAAQKRERKQAKRIANACTII